MVTLWIAECGPLDVHAQSQPAQAAPVVHKDRLGVVVGPPFVVARSISANGCRFACTIHAEQKQRVAVDGQPGPAYDSVEYVWFSPDGKHVAYVAQVGARECVILDGQPGAEYDQIPSFSWPFSPDSKHLAYPARKGDKCFAIVDGRPERQYDEISDFFVCADGRTAYAARKGGKWVAVVEGQEGPEYESITSLLQSAGGQHLAYQAKRGGKSFVVKDGQQSPGFDDAYFEFSPDGGHLAYWAARNTKKLAGTDQAWHMTFDGHAGAEYDAVGMPRFSADGKHLAYAVRNGSGFLLVVDGRPGPKYDFIDDLSPVLSPDGNRCAYSASDGNMSKQFMVVDGNAERKFDDVAWRAVFSPDGKHVAYGAMTRRFLRGTPWCVIEDGRPGPEYERLTNIEDAEACTPVFSGNSQRMAYAAKQGDNWFMVHDGKPGPKCDQLGYPDGHPIFSADSKHLVYFGEIGGKNVVFVDDQPLPPCDSIVCDPVFRTDGSSNTFPKTTNPALRSSIV